MSRDTQTESFSISKSAIRKTGRVLAGMVLVAVAVLAIGYFVRSRSMADQVPSAIDTRTYQAVFLTSGQVFFGKLSAESSDYYELRHVYVLLTSVTSSGRPNAQTLVKLTTETQSPTDLLLIARRQVLYLENLSPTGKAAKLLRASS